MRHHLSQTGAMRLRIIAAVLLVCVTACAGTTSGTARSGAENLGPPIPYRITHGLNDFMSFYAAGKLCGTRDLYTPMSAIREEWNATGYYGMHIPVVRLPFFALMMAPFSRLPYRTAYAVFQALSVLSIVAFIWMQGRAQERARGLMVCVTSFPLLLSVGLGQDVTFVMLLVAVFLRYWDEKPEVAGVALALCTIKYHLFPFMAVVVLLRRNRRLVASLLASLAVLAVLSFAVAGPSWPSQYVAQITRSWDVPDHMPNVRAVLLGTSHPLLYNCLLCVIVSALASSAAVRWRKNLPLCTAIALAAGILVTYHVFLQDCAILIPPLVEIWRSRTNAFLVGCALALLTPLAYVLRAVEVNPTYLIQFLLFALVGAAALWGPSNARRAGTSSVASSYTKKFRLA
jgi:Glycosyltransferase family 87